MVSKYLHDLRIKIQILEKKLHHCFDHPHDKASGYFMFQMMETI